MTFTNPFLFDPEFYKDDTKLTFLDVESTGIKPSEETLLQVACIVTDNKLNILDDEGYEAVVRFSAEEAKVLKQNAIPYVQNMHTKTNLWERLPEGKSLEQIDAELSAYIKQFAPKVNQSWLGGNSITLDRGFLTENLPLTDEHLHYRSVDVTSWAGPAKWWYGYSFEKKLLHEALSDIRESIAEFKAFRDLILRTPEEVKALLAES